MWRMDNTNAYGSWERIRCIKLNAYLFKFYFEVFMGDGASSV